MIDPNLRVLIVDDHRSMLKIIRGLLADIEITNVHEALDGGAALGLMKEHTYDLVLSDWNMLPMTGLEFVKHVRSNPNYRHQNVPFVMVTAEARPENVIEAKKAGVDNYVTKPFTAKTLHSKLVAVMFKKAS